MELLRFMTLSASLLIVAALLLRPLTGRIFPRRVQMLLWIAAALRLLIPVQIASPLSFFALFSARTSSPNSVSTPTTMHDIPVQNFTPAAPAQAVPPTGVHPTDISTFGVTEFLIWVWLCGAFLMGAVLIFLHIKELHRCRQKVRDQRLEVGVPGFIRIFRCAAVSSPFTYGIFRPKIILPEFLPDEDLPAVLAHELSHISALDLVKKHLFAAALCVNWFNPLVWIMVRCAVQDLEILCDARALRRPDAPDAKTYAHALLNAEERRTLFTLGFTSNTEVRIMKILKKEKHSRLILVLSVLLIALLVTGCVTMPTEKDTSAQKDEVSDSAHPTSAPTAKPEKSEPAAPEATAVPEPEEEYVSEPGTEVLFKTETTAGEDEYVTEVESEVLFETETTVGEDEYVTEYESEGTTEITPTAEEALASTIDSTVQQRYKMLLNERKAVEEQIKELQNKLEIIDDECKLYDTYEDTSE